MNKRWTLITLIITAVLLLGVAAFTIVIDPFFFYHAPSKKTGYTISNENYQNPGLAKNYEYDAVILGSSMVQNFSTEQIDELFDVQSIKLTYSGAYAYNHKVIMDVVQRNTDVDKVFLGIDIYSLLQPAEQTRNPLPLYLYDTFLLNDIEYILNKDVLLRAVQVLRNELANKANTTRDSAYNWYPANKDKFTLEAVLEHYKSSRGTEKEMQPKDIYMDEVAQNMEKNILSIIESSPDTDFYVFFSPYSIFYWDNAKYQGDLEAYLYIEEVVIKTLLKYDNVDIYFFQNDEDIICNIGNYKDVTHYHPDISSYMIKAMAAGEYVVTEENYIQQLKQMRYLINNCSIEALIEAYVSTDD